LLRNGFDELAARLRGLLSCLLQPGLFYCSIQKSMREEFNLLIKFCGTPFCSCCQDKVNTEIISKFEKENRKKHSNTTKYFVTSVTLCLPSVKISPTILNQ
jgi:hypothetical protein